MSGGKSGAGGGGGAGKGGPPGKGGPGEDPAGGGSARDKNLARQKLRAQQERERAAKAAARKRAQIIGSAVAVLLVIGGVFGAAQLIGNDKVESDGDPAAQPTDVVVDTRSPAPEGKFNCTYAKDITEAEGDKKVGLPPDVAEAKDPFYATIKTSAGDVEIKLLSADAPCAVNSFVHLAKAKFYDDTICHRELIDNGYGVLQCGDPTGTGSGGPGYTFADEHLDGAVYDKGVLAMANAGPGTNGSQFFMVFRDSKFEPNYTPFGSIEKGLDVLEKIAKEGTKVGDQGSKDVPKKTVKVEKVTISTKP